MFDIEQEDEHPAVTAWLFKHYETQRGKGGLSVRKRQAASAKSPFGGVKAQATAAEFERLSAIWPILLLDVQTNVKPVSKAVVVQAMHRVAEAAELAEMRARKESR